MRPIRNAPSGVRALAIAPKWDTLAGLDVKSGSGTSTWAVELLSLKVVPLAVATNWKLPASPAEKPVSVKLVVVAPLTVAVPPAPPETLLTLLVTLPLILTH